MKVLAGGQSLGPMLNLRLVEPDALVDIAGIPELRRIDREADALVVGAASPTPISRTAALPTSGPT
ncbi:FAD binding domain-containing protein [Chenggangzhangella methanolivorans]|uniref:FAD binding domain-containing protein n=1 Tax=Chenggangzhangella methanolivorans TaxID=1437009 RepID=UPI0021BD8F13|nr:FAD binding domain-containing protein [Chenggangzhangella methanolivorans]